MRQNGASVPISSTARTIATQLTNYGGTEAAGALSPDGRSFVFVSDHGGTPDIWLRQVSGGEPVRLTNDAAEEADLIYAADGESIYFTRIDASGSAIWRIGALGGPAQKILGDAWRPAPSPDGRNIAYLTATGSPSLEVIGLDGKGVARSRAGLMQGQGKRDRLGRPTVAGSRTARTDCLRQTTCLSSRSVQARHVR